MTAGNDWGFMPRRPGEGDQESEGKICTNGQPTRKSREDNLITIQVRGVFETKIRHSLPDRKAEKCLEADQSIQLQMHITVIIEPRPTPTFFPSSFA